MTTETNTTTETTTTKDGDNKVITTTTTTTEEYDEPEQLDFDFDPNKQLNEALEKQRQEERECIQKLIEENVRLDKEAKKAQEDAQLYQAKYEALQIELDDVKRGKKSSEPDPEPPRKEEQHVGYEKEDATVENYRIKLQDLEVRLQQLAEDDRIKDKVIENLSNNETEIRRYIDELETELGPQRVQDIKELMHARKEAGGKEAKIVIRSQIVRQGQATSTICSIM